MLTSKLCNQDDFEKGWFREACRILREPFCYNRKVWEWCFIYQALLERGLLAPGRKGLGFGVGKEPLAALFASHGCRVAATDMETRAARAFGWAQSEEHSDALEDLNERGICEPGEFQKLVTFEHMDMNDISAEHDNKYDFTWSACAFEHLGSIEAGKRFVLNQMNCLKPGGVAVHTTEFNLSSNSDTLERNPSYVIFRQQDFDWMVKALRDAGCTVEIDYTIGTGEIESHVDLPPYKTDPHLRLKIARYTCTSIGLIITKGAETGRFDYQPDTTLYHKSFGGGIKDRLVAQGIKFKNSINRIPGLRLLAKKIYHFFIS